MFLDNVIWNQPLYFLLFARMVHVVEWILAKFTLFQIISFWITEKETMQAVINCAIVQKRCQILNISRVSSWAPMAEPFHGLSLFTLVFEKLVVRSYYRSALFLSLLRNLVTYSQLWSLIALELCWESLELLGFDFGFQDIICA